VPAGIVCDRVLTHCACFGVKWMSRSEIRRKKERWNRNVRQVRLVDGEKVAWRGTGDGVVFTTIAVLGGPLDCDINTR